MTFHFGLGEAVAFVGFVIAMIGAVIGAWLTVRATQTQHATQIQGMKDELQALSKRFENFAAECEHYFEQQAELRVKTAQLETRADGSDVSFKRIEDKIDQIHNLLINQSRSGGRQA
jgi:hypothetical protein